MGDSGKLRFYELDHESKMRLLKTHSHTSNGLAMQPGKREENKLKEKQTLYNKANHPSKNSRAYRRCGGGRGTEKALRRTNHRQGTTASQTFAERKGNSGANTREKPCRKHSHRGPLAWQGLEARKRQMPGMEGDTTYTAPRGGEKCLAAPAVVLQVVIT